MNGVGEREREKTRETSLDRAKSQDDERESPDGGAESGKCFIFYRSFYTLS